MNLRDIKRVLMSHNGQIRLSKHTLERMEKRGYQKADIVSCIFTGHVIETQVQQGKICMVVKGVDKSSNPIIVIIGKDLRNPLANHYCIVSIMPPIKPRYKNA